MSLFKSIIVWMLTLESRLIIAKYKPFIVAVTGSVGKTSTKDAIYGVLKDQSKYVRKSEKSLNSDIGLPLTVIGVPNAWRNIWGWLNNIIRGAQLILKNNEYPNCLILEVGADHPGDIQKISKWLHPDIVVVTQIGTTPVHVEFFSSPEEVFEEKAALAEAIKPGGTLILFADNEKVLKLGERVKDKNVKIVSFGTGPQAEVSGTQQQFTYESTTTGQRPTGFDFCLTIGGFVTTVQVKGIIGQSAIYPLLAAVAVGSVKGVSMPNILTNLNSYEPPRGRMNIIEGLNDSILIDDTYNSSPDAAMSALKTLKSLASTSSKIAVLGDMLELGQYAAEEHRKVGREVSGVADILVTVGQRSRLTAEEALKDMPADRVRSFDTSREAGEYLVHIVKSGDIVLIKGSQSIRMERTVAVLMKNPERAPDLLVRQEKEWLNKK